MEHRFTGPSYTLGIEEELMIVDSETLELQNSIEAMLEALPQAEGQIKPELMESVLEVATTPCKNTREAGAQLRDLRRLTQRTASELGLAIGSVIFGLSHLPDPRYAVLATIAGVAYGWVYLRTGKVTASEGADCFVALLQGMAAGETHAQIDARLRKAQWSHPQASAIRPALRRAAIFPAA